MCIQAFRYALCTGRSAALRIGGRLRVFARGFSDKMFSTPGSDINSKPEFIIDDYSLLVADSAASLDAAAS